MLSYLPIARLLLAFFVMLACGVKLSLAKPNIVLIVADDLGWSDTSNTRTNLGHASDFYETPAIKQLSLKGMSFTNAYAGGATCAPTRAALLTGQYATRPTNNLFAVESLNKVPESRLVGPDQGLPTGTDAIPTNAFTYAEMLQQQGYATAHIGKFHVTEQGPSGAALIVSDHGFSKNYGGTQLGNPGQYHASNGSFVNHIGPELDAFAADYTQQYVDENIKPFSNGTSNSVIDALVGTDKHVSDAMADAAIQFMSEQKDGPFMVQFCAYAVHTPVGKIQARSDLFKKYQSKPPGTEDSNISFAALLEGLDQNVARIVHFLQSTPDPAHPERPMIDNTILFFYSDNGGREPQSNNGPLKGEKGVLDEGGIRVPLIAWSGNPNLVDGGTINDTQVTSVDFYRTFAALAGADVPEESLLDGEDLSGILADNNAVLDREALFWHFPGYNKRRTQNPQTVVRKGDWKLFYNYEDQSYELYDLKNDLSETTNLAATNSSKVAELSLTMLNWLKQVDAPLAMLRREQMVLNINGAYYANGKIQYHEGSVTLNAGEEVPFVVGDVHSLADLNADSQIDAADWAIFRSHQGANFTDQSAPEAFQRGDLDGDLDNDDHDFRLFKAAYNAANGAGAFQRL